MSQGLRKLPPPAPDPDMDPGSTDGGFGHYAIDWLMAGLLIAAMLLVLGILWRTA